MARLIHLNGTPGIGKSTLAALYADRHPGTLGLDADTVHRMVGGWADEDTDTWQVVWPVVHAMVAAHLDGGRDVVLPQFFGNAVNVARFEDLARRHGAGFREIVLIDDRAAAIERFNRRAANSDDPWIRHHRRLVERGGGDVMLGGMYDKLLEVMRLRPSAVVVRCEAGQVQEAYARLAEVLSR